VFFLQDDRLFDEPPTAIFLIGRWFAANKAVPDRMMNGWHQNPNGAKLFPMTSAISFSFVSNLSTGESAQS